MIKLICQDHVAEYEMNNIIHLFEPFLKDDYILETSYNQTQVVTILRKENTMLQEKKNLLQQIDKVQQKKQRKFILKQQAYNILSELTKQAMPWGMLTGIRPTKIVHEYLANGLSMESIKHILEKEYFILQDKIQLMIEVAQKEKLILDKNQKDEMNLYIGIPFCPTRCVYCSFTAYSIEKKADQVEAYLGALCKEIAYVAEAKKYNPIRSLYIGGGTPTSLNEKQLEVLLKCISNHFDTEKIQEYTIEAGRPDTITPEKLYLMKQYGVNRISINPQTMNQKTLDEIGRKHTVEKIKEVFALARNIGFDAINMDMIVGLPGETVEDVSYTLEELTLLAPDNITVHTMAIKKGSRLKENKQYYELAKAKQIEQMLCLCDKKIRKSGLNAYYLYRQKNMLGNYENVGYAKEGKECVYNVEIMEEKQSIIAMGAGAITKMVYQNGEKIDRIANVKSLEDYILRIDEMIERKEKGFIMYQ